MGRVTGQVGALGDRSGVDHVVDDVLDRAGRRGWRRRAPRASSGPCRRGRRRAGCRPAARRSTDDRSRPRASIPASKLAFLARFGPVSREIAATANTTTRAPKRIYVVLKFMESMTA